MSNASYIQMSWLDSPDMPAAAAAVAPESAPAVQPAVVATRATPSRNPHIEQAANDIALTVTNDGEVYRRFFQPLTTGGSVRMGAVTISSEHLLQGSPTPEIRRALRDLVGQAIDCAIPRAHRDPGTWQEARQVATEEILGRYREHVVECADDDPPPAAAAVTAPTPVVPATASPDTPPTPSFAGSRATFAVEDDIGDLLRQCVVSHDSVTIPGQLPRETYERLNKVLTAAGGRWNRSRRAHVFARDPRDVLASALTTGQAVDVQKHYQAFYTPPELAELLVRKTELADYTCPRVLEPSCGDGRLLAAIARHSTSAARVQAYEIDPVAAAAARSQAQPNVTVSERDFLTVPAGQDYQVIVMNPPFSRGLDIVHVTRALDHLAPSGRLVTVMSTSWQTAQTAKPRAFRELIAHWQADVETLPAGMFSSSGTDIATTLLTFRSPSPGDPRYRDWYPPA